MNILLRSIVVIMLLTRHVVYTTAFQPTITHMSIKINDNDPSTSNQLSLSSPGRRRSSIMMAGGFLSNLFGDDGNSNGIINPANAAEGIKKINSGKGATNEVIKTVNGMKQRRLGGSDIIVSELGLGTQRW